MNPFSIVCHILTWLVPALTPPPPPPPPPSFTKFLSLPPELRLLIYAHVFGHRPLVVTVSDWGTWRLLPSEDHEHDPSFLYTYPHNVKKKKPFTVALLRANRQIYWEALPVFYASVSFTHDFCCTFLLGLLGHMSDYARDHVRCIRLRPEMIIPINNAPQDWERTGLMDLCTSLAWLKGLRKVEVLCPPDSFPCDEEAAMKEIGAALGLVKVRKMVVTGEARDYSAGWEERLGKLLEEGKPD
ncbi:uncharacterized protein BO80DRAFT_427566 [Aspergillus ibericus CBS 121593]|uniref:DUF7730 domain-containing protein n=1 Tax=Aspergillus ibericus CBS 121593 TaxID=1448316 RepID=A0A395GTI9_9EURO|nr:hypothetical protein BO80DRAFT_427566 [Aspergillus ibericus CBS 121593]RAK98268.1 hypothetical protein BO80DRAFT_427566 [Aspergillus ibericus CBS 121593]